MASLVGSFLVADRALDASRFRRAVVLILQHRKEGAFGLVVNQPRSPDSQPYPVFSGGPCKANGLLMLHGHAEWNPPNLPAREVAPGIFVGDFASVQRVSESGAGYHFRMINGYACWSRGQLEAELGAELWTLVPAEATLLFGTPPEQLWDLLGPPRLPGPSRN